MQIIVHLLNVNERPAEGSLVQVNCGKELNFKSIDASWESGRICRECDKVFRSQRTKGTLTFAACEVKEEASSGTLSDLGC